MEFRNSESSERYVHVSQSANVKCTRRNGDENASSVTKVGIVKMPPVCQF